MQISLGRAKRKRLKASARAMSSRTIESAHMSLLLARYRFSRVQMRSAPEAFAGASCAAALT